MVGHLDAEAASRYKMYADGIERSGRTRVQVPGMKLKKPGASGRLTAIIQSSGAPHFIWVNATPLLFCVRQTRDISWLPSRLSLFLSLGEQLPVEADR